MNSTPFAITMGDPCGIGPEIIAKLFRDGPGAPAVVVGDPAVLARAVHAIGGGPEPQVVADVAGGRGVRFPVIAAATLDAALPWGRVDARAGRAAYDCILRAVALVRAGEAAGIVTAPLHKAALRAAGIPHPGHTELLAELAGVERVGMMLANDVLRVMLVSVHVPLAEAIRLLTVESVSRAVRFADAGARAFGVASPRVAVAGVNPHAGEGGLFGREEIEIIAPAVEAARREGIDASGPWPPDTVYMRARLGAFDIVVAPYHDQGLIPIKYLGLDQGVNVTVGLPFIRTSVDHGTAFDIAGQGVADPASLATALRVADRMARGPLRPLVLSPSRPEEMWP